MRITMSLVLLMLMGAAWAAGVPAPQFSTPRDGFDMTVDVSQTIIPGHWLYKTIVVQDYASGTVVPITVRYKWVPDQYVSNGKTTDKRNYGPRYPK